MSNSAQKSGNQSNPGIIIFRTSENPTEAQKTIVITGPSRSGTTMMAQIVKTLGIHLGDAVDVNLLEDIEIRNASKSGDVESMKRILSERNDANPIWGWKYPGSLEHLAGFASPTAQSILYFHLPRSYRHNGSQPDLRIRKPQSHRHRRGRLELHEAGNSVDSRTLTPSRRSIL